MLFTMASNDLDRTGMIQVADPVGVPPKQKDSSQ